MDLSEKIALVTGAAIGIGKGCVEELAYKGYITPKGTLSAIEKYFPKYKNFSSISGIVPVEFCPLYNASKHGVIGLTRTYGLNRHLRKDGIYMMALCPAGTKTVMVDYMRDIVNYKDVYDEEMIHLNSKQQKVNAVGKAAIQAMLDSDSGSAWLVEAGVAH